MGVFVEKTCECSPPRPPDQRNSKPPSSSRAMELQKRAFELVVDSMLPGLDAELGAVDEVLSIFRTSRLANRRRVLQWVGTHYLVVGAAKFNEWDRVLDELVAVQSRMHHLWDFPAEFREAGRIQDRLQEEQGRLYRFFQADLISVCNGRGDWRRWLGFVNDFWRHVLSVTLTKWSRLRD